MELESELSDLKPRKKGKVFDLVSSLGFDTTDWVATAKNTAKIKANPKYCYDWSFVQPDKVAIFNLWYDTMKIEDGSIIYQDNFRKNAEFHRLNGGKQKWIARGIKLDHDAAQAAQDNLPIRVIVVDGRRRATEDPDSDSSKVSARELDPSPWHVRSYDTHTGEFVLSRGISQSRYIDQFNAVDIQADVSRKEVHGTILSRSSAVRQAALERSRGKCEYCGQPGFMTGKGQIYLETHHIVPLSENGLDATSNVIAVCPTDHRKAHYGEDATAMRQQMLKVIADKTGS